MQHPHFTDADGSFAPDRPEEISQLYFPLTSETGLKSRVLPDLGGDAKLDQETFLLKPVSVENLHNNRSIRNFWLVDEDGTAYSLTRASPLSRRPGSPPPKEDSRLGEADVRACTGREIGRPTVCPAHRKAPESVQSVQIPALLFGMINRCPGDKCFCHRLCFSPRLLYNESKRDIVRGDSHAGKVLSHALRGHSLLGEQGPGPRSHHSGFSAGADR